MVMKARCHMLELYIIPTMFAFCPFYWATVIYISKPNAPPRTLYGSQSHGKVLATSTSQYTSASPRPSFYLNSIAFCDTRRPMMRPNSPRTELKISMTRILTNLTELSVRKKNEGG
jgi:hypothetical protein